MTLDQLLTMSWNFSLLVCEVLGPRFGGPRRAWGQGVEVGKEVAPKAAGCRHILPLRSAAVAARSTVLVKKCDSI